MILSPAFMYFMPVAIFVVVMVSITAWRIRAGYKPRPGNYVIWLMCAVFVVYMVWKGLHAINATG